MGEQKTPAYFSMVADDPERMAAYKMLSVDSPVKRNLLMRLIDKDPLACAIREKWAESLDSVDGLVLCDYLQETTTGSEELLEEFRSNLMKRRK